MTYQWWCVVKAPFNLTPACLTAFKTWSNRNERAVHKRCSLQTCLAWNYISHFWWFNWIDNCCFLSCFINNQIHKVVLQGRNYLYTHAAMTDILEVWVHFGWYLTVLNKCWKAYTELDKHSAHCGLLSGHDNRYKGGEASSENFEHVYSHLGHVVSTVINIAVTIDWSHSSLKSWQDNCCSCLEHWSVDAIIKAELCTPDVCTLCCEKSWIA